MINIFAEGLNDWVTPEVKPTYNGGVSQAKNCTCSEDDTIFNAVSGFTSSECYDQFMSFLNTFIKIPNVSIKIPKTEIKIPEQTIKIPNNIKIPDVEERTMGILQKAMDM